MKRRRKTLLSLVSWGNTQVRRSGTTRALYHVCTAHDPAYEKRVELSEGEASEARWWHEHYTSVASTRLQLPGRNITQVYADASADAVSGAYRTARAARNLTAEVRNQSSTLGAFSPKGDCEYRPSLSLLHLFVAEINKLIYPRANGTQWRQR